MFQKVRIPMNFIDIRYHSNIEDPTTAQGMMGNKIINSKFELTILPNPAVNIIRVRYQLSKAEPIQIKLYNITGKLIKTLTKSKPTKNNEFQIDTKFLPSGVYLLRFESIDIKVIRKLILNK